MYCYPEMETLDFLDDLVIIYGTIFNPFPLYTIILFNSNRTIF